MQQIYTIPINEAFDASAEDKSCGCPMCALYRMLEENALDTAMGGSMMEPSVRISMNEEGFCKIHYDMLFEMKNRLGMALTLESHLNELKDDLSPKGLASLMPKNTASKIERLENSCYICSRVDGHFNMMIDIVVSLWKKDEQFPKKLKAQPYFCLPHYRQLLESAKRNLGKKEFPEFEKDISGVVNAYLEKLAADVSWFCKKYDYNYENEPWYDSKDAVERAMIFLRSDLHHPQKKKLRSFGGLT